MMKFLTKDKLIYIVCSIFLLIQIGQLFHQYLDQSLVTNIKFSSKNPETLPAVTICYDKVFYFLKMEQRFNPSIIREKFINYRTLIDSAVFDHGNNPSEDVLAELKSYENFYDEKVKWIIENVKNRSIDLHDMFDNLTLPFSFTKSEQIIWLVYFGQVILESSDLVNPFITFNKNFYVTYPVESIFKMKWKCYTFFSDLQKVYRNLKITDKEIRFLIRFPKFLFPFGLNRKILISMHSPKELPREFSFIELDQAHDATITYSRIENKQEHNYFKCQDYSNHDKFRMKSDCFFNCMMKISPIVCLDYYRMIETMFYPIRKELFYKEYPYYNCSNGRYRSTIVSLQSKCMYQCPDECDQKYFFMQHKNSKRRSYNYDRDQIVKTLSQIQILSSDLPTIIIIHLPEMTLISLLCNLGGLIGMWLGISIASTFGKLTDLVKVSITNLISSCITNNTTINNPSLTLFNLNVFKIFKRNRSKVRNNIDNSW